MRSISSIAGVALLVLTGCGPAGPRPMKVWGEVTFDGKPLESGSIRFLPLPNSTQGTATEGDIQNGRYEIPAKDGPLSSLTYKVEIRAQRKVGTVANPMNPTGPPLDRFDNFIPAAYNHESTLTATIADTEAANQHDFHLKPK